MTKKKLGIVFGVLLLLALTASAFAELVVTYSTSDDGWSEYSAPDSDEAKADAEANSLIENGDFTEWGTALGPSDPWTFWRDTTAGWTAGRLHEFDLALPANPDGINNAMGWFIQHSGAKSGGYYAGAYQQLNEIPVSGLYYVSVSTTAFSDGKTGPYNSVAWYAISDSSDPSGVTDWRELFPDTLVCANSAGVCNYVGRDETVNINPGQYFHLMVGRKFPEFFGWTMFIIDDISIVAADGTLNTDNGFYNWCNSGSQDVKDHVGNCESFTEVHWDPDQTR
ncbi:MAG TPA: hypothetical protein VF434_10735 [Promineifilum sp.]